MATSWALTVCLVFIRTDHEGGRQQSLEGDEFNKAAPEPPAPAAPAPAAPAPAAEENGARPAEEPRTPPAGASAGAEAEAGDPGAPGNF